MKISVREKIRELRKKWAGADYLRGFNIEDDNPTLCSILQLMEARQQEHIERGSLPCLPPDEAKAELRCVSALQEVEELIYELIQRARKESQ